MARWEYNLVHINGGSHEDLFGGVRFELGRLRKGKWHCLLSLCENGVNVYMKRLVVWMII